MYLFTSRRSTLHLVYKLCQSQPRAMDLVDLHPPDDYSHRFFIWHEWIMASLIVQALPLSHYSNRRPMDRLRPRTCSSTLPPPCSMINRAIIKCCACKPCTQGNPLQTRLRSSSTWNVVSLTRYLIVYTGDLLA